MGESHACGLKTRISRINDNQLTPDLQSGRKNKIHFNFTEMFQKKWLVLTSCPNCVTKRKNCFGSAQRLSEHLRTFSPKFGKSRKYSEVAGIFSEIWVMTRSDENLTHLTQKKLAGIQ